MSQVREAAKAFLRVSRPAVLRAVLSRGIGCGQTDGPGNGGDEAGTMDGPRELCESLGRIKEETRRSEIALFHAGTKRETGTTQPS
jgi:hypothetical protein